MVIGNSSAIQENLARSSGDVTGHLAPRQTEWLWTSHCPCRGQFPSLSFYYMFWSYLGGILPLPRLIWPSQAWLDTRGSRMGTWPVYLFCCEDKDSCLLKAGPLVYGKASLLSWVGLAS